jgi:hypothetical protein
MILFVRDLTVIDAAYLCPHRGVVNAVVAEALVQYVNVKPVSEPVVTLDAVKSTVAGEQTADGLVTTNVGNALTVTVTG